MHEMGRASSVYGGEEKRMEGFGDRNLNRKTTWETQAWMGV